MKPKNPKPEALWFVAGRYGVYCGGGMLTRRSAIEDHVEAVGKSWGECKRDGDFVARYELVRYANGAAK